MRIALYGGTFDPIHVGHVTVAREVRDAFSLDAVVLVPAGNPPHKSHRTGAPYEDRLRMAALAVEGEPALRVADWERGPERSYTLHTLQKVRQLWPQLQQLLFVIGADAFAEIESWHRWREVLKLTEFVVISRPGHRYEVPAEARVHRLDSLCLDISSSHIREVLARGQSSPDLPTAVARFIEQNGLYRPASPAS